MLLSGGPLLSEFYGMSLGLNVGPKWEGYKSGILFVSFSKGMDLNTRCENVGLGILGDSI